MLFKKIFFRVFDVFMSIGPFDSIAGILDICVITWNLEGTSGPQSASDLVKSGSHHIYVVGTEECERSIAASYVLSSKDTWEGKLGDALGDQYKLIASETLMAIHIVMFASLDIAHYITQVSTDRVATGLFNGKVGNKGGVCISCLIGDTSVLFVNSHFAAHQNSVEDRNGDFRKICFGTSLKPPRSLSGSPEPSTPDAESPKSKATPDSKRFNITERYDAVFWSGDLNYRINGLRNMVDVLLKDDAFKDVLLANDQLSIERKKGTVFPGFLEGPLQFNPTYKFHKEDGRATEEYDKSAKCRIPAWTDRVLYRTNAPFPAAHLTLRSYGSLDADSLRVSDHRPVVAIFSLKVRPITDPPPTPPTASAASRTCIIS